MNRIEKVFENQKQMETRSMKKVFEYYLTFPCLQITESERSKSETSDVEICLRPMSSDRCQGED